MRRLAELGGCVRAAIQGRKAQPPTILADMSSRNRSNNSGPSLSPLFLAASLAVALTAAAALRAAAWDRVALCFFEEGVQAASAQGVLAEGMWSYDYSLPYHSPPLQAWLHALVSWLAGFGVTHGVLVSVTANLLTILGVYGIGRRMVGDGFGVAAAALFGLSDLQIAVARTGLPNATLTLWVTLAIWAALELAPRAIRCSRSGQASSDSGLSNSNGVAATALPRLSYYAFWGVMLGIFLALAVATQYIGIATVGVLIMGFLWAWLRGSQETMGRMPYLFTAFCIAGAISLGAFAAWYWHLERTYPGGVTPVLRNVAADAAAWRWPQHLGRMLASLPALRHWGWVITLPILGGVALSAALAKAGWQRTLGLTAALIALAAATVAGGDALLLICGMAAAVPALLSRQWGPALCSIWLIVFLGVAACLHPSPRHLAAAFPPGLLLALWLVWPSHSRSSEETQSSLPWLAAGLLGAGCLALLSPFGATPTQTMWSRWSPGSGYDDFGHRVAIETPTEAAIICQGQPPLYAYCQREWATMFGDASFLRGLKDLAVDHPTYLALDFRYLEEPALAGDGAEVREARDAVVQWLHCLEPIAVTPLEPSVLMLLDHLPPSAVYTKLHSRLVESKWTDKDGHKTSVPPDIRTSGEDVIVLYRVDVERIRNEGGL